MGKSERMQDLFVRASELPPDARAAYLDAACAGDAALRAEVESLLRAHDEAGSFLADPTGGAPSFSAAQAATIAAPLREGPGTRIGPYKILQLIGEGGFGSVFMAEQEKPVSRKVALKIIKLGMDTRAVIARFEAERQALALMEHANIARVLDAGATEAGRPFFVMELCKGDPIHEYCDKNNLSIRDRLELFAQVCTAVQHAHTKGIIHRDIKPSNVLVSTQDGRPHAKVIDFGIAKATASKLTEKTLFTEHRALIGTPEYMSPEQAEGSLDIDTRTDVYSLGVLLYELLTGTTPFSSQELRSAAYAEIQRIIREVEPPKPSTRLSHNTQTLASVAAHRHTEPRRLGTIVRGELDWIVMKALEKDRQRRYETADGLAMDIRRYLSGEAILAAPPSAAYRMRKFVYRHRAQVAAAGLVTVALLLGLAGTAWQANAASGQARATKARADELKQVSDFQSKMLSQVDPTTAGLRLTKDVNRRLAAALEKAKVPEAQRAEMTDAFKALWARVNATDAAAALIDETILAPAVKAIEEQFKDQPIIDAQLRQALADRYRHLGLYDAAMTLQQRTLDTRRRVLGEEHPDTLTSISGMSRLLQERARHPESEPYCREVLEKRRRVLGEEHPDTIDSIIRLGLALGDQRVFDEAEMLLRDALAKSRRVLGEQHPLTLETISLLGFELQRAGKHADAEPFVRERLEKQRDATSVIDMGLLLRAQEKLSDAEPYFREALELYRREWGEDHPYALHALNGLGGLLVSQGKLADAELVFREAYAKRRLLFGDEDMETLWNFRQIGLVLRDQGRFAEAEPYLREALAKRRRLVGEDQLDTVTSLDYLGLLLQDQGNFAEAESLFLEALEKHRRLGEQDQPSLPHRVESLVHLYTAWDRAEPGKGYDAMAAQWQATLDDAPSAPDKK